MATASDQTWRDRLSKGDTVLIRVTIPLPGSTEAQILVQGITDRATNQSWPQEQVLSDRMVWLQGELVQVLTNRREVLLIEFDFWADDEDSDDWVGSNDLSEFQELIGSLPATVRYSICLPRSSPDLRQRMGIDIVMTLTVAAVDENCRLQIECHGLGGGKVATIETDIVDTIGTIQRKLSAEMDVPKVHVKCTTVDGRLLHFMDKVSTIHPAISDDTVWAGLFGRVLLQSALETPRASSFGRCLLQHALETPSCT